MKTYSLDEIIEEHIGPLGTPKHDIFEEKLRLNLLGKAIKEARSQRHLTHQHLGDLVGVQKAQISKLENSPTDARFGTVMKVFRVLDAKVNFSVESSNQGASVVYSCQFSEPPGPVN